jgi:hypothetical protein
MSWTAATLVEVCVGLEYMLASKISFELFLSYSAVGLGKQPGTDGQFAQSF